MVARAKRVHMAAMKSSSSAKKKRTTTTSRKSQAYANRAIKAGRKALLHEVSKGMYEAYLQNNNRLPYGHVGGLLSEMKSSHKWLTRNIINKAFMKFRKDLKNVSKKEDEKESPVPEEINLEKSTTSSALTVSTVSFESDFRLGRPVGSTDENKFV